MSTIYEEHNINAIEAASVYGLDLLSFNLMVDDGLIKKIDIQTGFVNRNIMDLKFIKSPKLYPLVFEKIDHSYSQYYSNLFVKSFENLLGYIIESRTELIRALLLEQSKLYGLLSFFYKISIILEISPLANYSTREKDRVSDLFEMYCGSRLGFGAINLFQATNDTSDGYLYKVEKTLDFLKQYASELNILLLNHPLFLKRAIGLANVREDFFDNENFMMSDYSIIGTDVYRRIANKYECFCLSINKVSEIISLLNKSQPEKDRSNQTTKEDSMPWCFYSTKTPRGDAGLYIEYDVQEKIIKSFSISTYSKRILPILKNVIIGNDLDDLGLIVSSFDLNSSEIDL